MNHGEDIFTQVGAKWVCVFERGCGLGAEVTGRDWGVTGAGILDNHRCFLPAPWSPLRSPPLPSSGGGAPRRPMAQYTRVDPKYVFAAKGESHGFGLDQPSRVTYFPSHRIDQTFRLKVEGVRCLPPSNVACIDLWNLFGCARGGFLVG